MMKKSENWTLERGLNLNFTLSNGYSGTDLMFLFKDGLFRSF